VLLVFAGTFVLDQELILSCSCWGNLFKSDWDEIWHVSSSSKYTLIDGVWFSIWCHTFKMAYMTFFHTTKCCHLVSETVGSGAYAAASASSWSIVHLYLLLLTDVVINY